jgi:PAS domain S-box-containing protein
MTSKPSYSQLEKKVKALEKELSGHHAIEKMLWEKQDQLFKVLDSLDAIVYVSDMQSYEILYANRYAENLFGSITGKICWNVLQSDMTGPCPFCKISEIVTPEKKPKDIVVWENINTITGKWCSIRDRAIEWFDDRLVHLQIAINISHGKKVEAALQKKKKKFRTVADFTYDWEYWINEHGNFNYISPSCKRITGYSVEEFEENHALLSDIVHPDDKQFFSEHINEELQTSKVCHLNFRIISRQGEERWISHYCQPVYGQDKNFLGRRASNRDITEQKKAQEHIKYNEVRRAALLKLYEMQSLPVKEVCQYVLEASQSLTGSKIGWMGFMNEDESQLTIHAWSKSVMSQCKIHGKPIVFKIIDAGLWGEAVRQRQPIIINDYNFTSVKKKGVPTGHVEIDRFMAVPLFDEGKIVAVIAVGNKGQDYEEQDVNQLQLLIEGMWQIVKRRETEDELLRQAEMIKHFTNKVVHDLKNPAIAIFGLARILERKHERLSKEKLKNFIEQIVNSSAQIISLSDDINAYISTRESRLHFVDLNLREIWGIIREEFLPRLKKRDIMWVEPDIEIPVITADKHALLRVYRNLVDNALKYGGRKLTEITMGYIPSAMYHVLTVQNNGKVIPPEEVESIFKLFKRKADESTIGGTGLGLTIVREIARQHKGDSWVESGNDGKTTFYLSIVQNLNGNAVR